MDPTSKVKHNALFCTPERFEVHDGMSAGERPVRDHTSAAHETKAARSIFDKFDINGDGLLSFAEFLLVLSLLSIPEDDVAVIFRWEGLFQCFLPCIHVVALITAAAAAVVVVVVAVGQTLKLNQTVSSSGKVCSFTQVIGTWMVAVFRQLLVKERH
eukprot:1161700-Pelagomonas_calceolata.AAC.9